MTLPINVSEEEVEMLQTGLTLYKDEHWRHFDFDDLDAKQRYEQQEQKRKILSNKVLFLKLQLAGVPLEEAITIIGMAPPSV